MSITENITKAEHSASFLLQDLRALNRECDPVMSLLVLQEIEAVAKLQARLSSLASAIESRDVDSASPAPGA